MVLILVALLFFVVGLSCCLFNFCYCVWVWAVCVLMLCVCDCYDLLSVVCW